MSYTFLLFCSHWLLMDLYTIMHLSRSFSKWRMIAQQHFARVPKMINYKKSQVEISLFIFYSFGLPVLFCFSLQLAYNCVLEADFWKCATLHFLCIHIWCFLSSVRTNKLCFFSIKRCPYSNISASDFVQQNVKKR